MSEVYYAKSRPDSFGENSIMYVKIYLLGNIEMFISCSLEDIVRLRKLKKNSVVGFQFVRVFAICCLGVSVF